MLTLKNSRPQRFGDCIRRIGRSRRLKHLAAKFGSGVTPRRECGRVQGIGYTFSHKSKCPGFDPLDGLKD